MRSTRFPTPRRLTVHCGLSHIFHGPNRPRTLCSVGARMSHLSSMSTIPSRYSRGTHQGQLERECPQLSMNGRHRSAEIRMLATFGATPVATRLGKITAIFRHESQRERVDFDFRSLPPIQTGANAVNLCRLRPRLVRFVSKGQPGFMSPVRKFEDIVDYWNLRLTSTSLLRPCHSGRLLALKNAYMEILQGGHLIQMDG